MPQPILNAKATLLRYVETRKGMQSLPRATKSSEPGEPPISDATVRAYVSLLRAERDEAVRLKNRIIAGLRKIPGIPIETLIANGFTPPTVEPTAASSTLSPTTANAISKLLAPEKLANIGLELHRSRLRNSITAELLLDKSEVEALQALLAGQSEDDAHALPSN